MPVRIYALAKDLKLDSKELVDICTKAGIQGKGSALASLEDDEVAKVKTFLEGGASKKAPAAQSAASAAPAAAAEKSQRIGAPIRPTADTIPAPGAAKKPIVIGSTRKPAAAEAPAPAIEPETPAAVTESGSDVPEIAAKAPEVSLPETTSAPIAPTAASEAPAASIAAAVPGTPPTGPIRATERPGGPINRERFMSPGAKGPIRVIGSARNEARKPGDAGPPQGSPPSGRREAPTMRFAAMPDVKQPAPRPAAPSNVQKPMISLRPDALKGNAPIESVLKGMEKANDAATRNKAAGKSMTPLAPGELPGASPLSNRLKGKKGVRVGDEAERAGGSMDAIRADRLKKPSRPQFGDPSRDDDRRSSRVKRIHRVNRGHTTTAPRKGKLQVELPCTVRTFSEQAGVGTGQVMSTLMGMGMMLNINAAIPDEYVEMLAGELGLDLEIQQPESPEEKMLKQFGAEDAPESLDRRPPIVTFLGHVDHGKTSLMDRIIGTNVVAGEAGGITQHIRAYAITTKSGRQISFVDTPGHEAFTEMRARGANVTDIAVLIVAADDGVMPQTEEAISHAKAAGVPIVVALNKIDLPGANPQRVLEQLAANELLPSEWGGQVEVMRTSAITGQGVEELLETLLLTADIHDFKANPNRPADGTCLEAEQEPGRGVIAKVMVRGGTLKDGDIVVCGPAHGRVKAMYDTLDARKKITSAGPSIPVNLTGLDTVPNAGDAFYVLDDIGVAREIAAERANQSRQRSLSGITKRVSLEEFQKRLAEGRIGQDVEKVFLNLIIRADVRGSIEAIHKELSKFDHPEVEIKVLQSSVGAISVADVTLASASDAVIVGFNVIPDEAARALAEERQVEIRRYEIIYKLTDDIRAMLEGKLKPEERIVELGRVLVKQVFVISRVGAVAGCYVIQGNLERNTRAKVFRDGRMVGDYAIESLRRDKDDVKEVSRGMECGIKLAGYNDIKQDDVLEVYKVEEFARTL